jgi:hypothetical protein
MPHVFEPAATSRSKCRGCGLLLKKDEVRFGERLANPFADGEMTRWFHPICAAYKRPDAMLEALETAPQDLAGRTDLERVAHSGTAHPRRPRIDGAERSPSSQARCRQCKEPIEKGTWRIRLVFHEEGSFSPGGFIHLACRQPYFETGDIVDAVLHFSGALQAAEREALEKELSTS